MRHVAITATEHTLIGKRKESLLELLVEAAGPLLRHGQPQALVVGSMCPARSGDLPNPAMALVERLGLEGVAAWTVEGASATGAAALHSGWRAVATGQFQRVLVVGGEKLTHLLTPQATNLLATVLTPEERTAGRSMVSLAAWLTRRALSEDRLSRAAMQAVALKNHRQGALNPKAQFQAGLTDEQYLNSRMINEPLRLFDCAPVSDGAAAVMLERYEKGPAVALAGVGQATTAWSVAERQDPLRFAATRRAARQAYEMAGWGPRRVELVEMHDAFSSFELLGLEACGLFREGAAGPATLHGETGPEGRLPVNLSGGLKARGHPIGGTGLAQVCELFWQLGGEAGPRQVAGSPRRALAHNIGGMAANNCVTLLELST